MSDKNFQSRKETGSQLPIPENAKPRIDYIDLLKGLTILWIIWIHTDHPYFGNYRNTVFFFVSGIFFKITDAKTFFSKRLFLIIIPFIFFYFAAIPYEYVASAWDNKRFDAFEWNRLLDIFKCMGGHGYLTLCYPLWFLLTLLFIQIYSFVLFRLPRWCILVTAVLSLIFFEYLDSEIPTPFMMNNALAWYGYFAFGYLTGMPLIKYLNSLPRKAYVFTITLAIVIGCVWFQSLEIADWHNMIEKTKILVFIVCFMTFFSFFDGWNKLEVLRFFGKNSLIVLGAHLWILLPLARITHRLTRENNPWHGLICAILTAIILIPIIRWMNRNIPLLVGKRRIK